MDVAIRAANWCLAVSLFESAPLAPGFWARMLAELWVAGRFVERHLEWHPVYRGNHFVANAVGLVYLGVLFRGTPDGDRWLATGHAHLVRELDYQVGEDGVSFEAALAYHRLVTELFAYAGELLRRNVEGFDARRYDAKLERMHRFMGIYLQPDGRAPMIGDADDGRLHVLSAASLAEPRRHGLGLPGRHAVTQPARGAWSFPRGGFHVLRHDGDHAVIRCGPVGLRGAGSHDHNDQLGFELVLGGRRVVADSGTYAYGRDLAARHAFRSAAAHSVVEIGGEEPNPLDPARPWRVLEDRTRALCTRCGADDGRLVFAGEHSGYAHRPSGAVCRRELARHQDGSWLLEDVVEGQGEEVVAWRLHLACTPAEARLRGGPGGAGGPDGQPGAGAVGSWRVDVPGARLELELPAGLEPVLEATQGSDAYGVLEARCAVVAAGAAALPLRVRCRITAVTGAGVAGDEETG
jgi:hypothetical protein